MSEEFKTWAIVEVMGHNEYAGFVTAETIAGAPFLRIDVPETSVRPGFTKYLATNSIYGISPCSEETARARAESKKTTPFHCWDVESQVTAKLREKGLLLDHKPIEVNRSSAFDPSEKTVHDDDIAYDEMDEDDPEF